MDDILVIVDLHRPGDGAGIANGVDGRNAESIGAFFVLVVVAEVRIRRPGHVGGIDLGREPFFETMELVGTHEMHFSRDAGVIPMSPQVMGKGRGGGGEFRTIVVGPNARWQAAGHHAEPRWCTERIGAIGVFKHRALRRQCVDIGGLADRAAIGVQHERGKLIDHEQQDIWFLAHW